MVVLAAAQLGAGASGGRSQWLLDAAQKFSAVMFKRHLVCRQSLAEAYSMAFHCHIDCDGRHGLISIDKKPASYGTMEWKCKACKRLIPDQLIGVLNCERCRVDICPSCWTVLLPTIVNASGYPCFWREVRPPHARSVTKMLGCHRRHVCVNGSPAQYHQACGVDSTAGSCFGISPTVQCEMCEAKQRELAAAPRERAEEVAPPSQSHSVQSLMGARVVVGPPIIEPCRECEARFPRSGLLGL